MTYANVLFTRLNSAPSIMTVFDDLQDAISRCKVFSGVVAMRISCGEGKSNVILPAMVPRATRSKVPPFVLPVM